MLRCASPYCIITLVAKLYTGNPGKEVHRHAVIFSVYHDFDRDCGYGRCDH